MFLLALTTFLSAFLLFLLQPIIGKHILPWFGGSAAVWSTCLVFFQTALLAGYFYSDRIANRYSLRTQGIVHLSLLVLAIALLPITPNESFKPLDNAWPAVRILILLTATIGLPYFLLSTTSPLLQSWFARAYPGVSPYRLFALSNFASLLSLLSYPLLIEPHTSLGQQAVGWSIGFIAFALVLALTLRQVQRKARALHETPELPLPESHAPIASSPRYKDKLVWMALSAVGACLLLSVSTHLTQNVASIPLLWVLPLALYLLTFTLCFNASSGGNISRWYPLALARILAAISIVALAWLLQSRKFEFDLAIQCAAFLSGLFFICMYCHSELVARKPVIEHLTSFYLSISLGGALGSLLVGIVAPLTLSANYELGVTLYVVGALMTALLTRKVHRAWVFASGLVGVYALVAFALSLREFRDDTVVMSRNFYGMLRVKEHPAYANELPKRQLVHGAILHGEQFIDAPARYAATSYYTAKSGVGIALKERYDTLQRPRRVGIIGLGAGTLAAYGDRGEVFRFYEINPAVVEIADRDFTFLKDTLARIEVAVGDARLSLERESPQHFDVLAIDAFSGDSIPFHLLTLEALRIYEKHMQPDGIIAFHVSNRFLQLHPVVQRLAEERGLAVAWIEEVGSDGGTDSDWVLLCKDKRVFEQAVYVEASQPIPPRPEWRLWTDDFNNLFQVLR